MYVQETFPQYPVLERLILLLAKPLLICVAMYGSSCCMLQKVCDDLEDESYQCQNLKTPNWKKILPCLLELLLDLARRA